MSRETQVQAPGDGTASSTHPTSWAIVWGYRILLAITLTVHCWLTFRLFPSWQSLVDDQPIISVDHAIHLYHGYLGAKFLKEHGTSWGYDPYFMAGYPKTPVYDSSSGPAELFQLMAGGQYSPRAYKIGIALVVALVPVVIGLAAWAYALRAPSILCTVAWLVWYWWTGFADTLVRTGLVAFVWASALAVLVPAFLLRWSNQPRWANWVALSFAAALGIQAHSIFPLMVAVPLTVGYVWSAMGGAAPRTNEKCRPGWRWHVATWLALGVALLVTSFWWWPLLQFLPLKTASDLFMKYEGNPLDPFAKRVAGLVLTYYLSSDAMIPFLLLLFGLIGLVHCCVSGRKLQAAMLGSQIAGLALLTFVGSEWDVTRNLEPLRFSVPLGLALCPAAGEGLSLVLASLAPHRLWRDAAAMLRWVPAALVLALSIVVTFPFLWWSRIGLNRNVCPPSSWRATAIRIQSARPLAVGLRAEMIELVDWIREHTDTSARVLLEDQLRLLENADPSAPESIHWTPLLPVLTGRQFVGGLYHLAFIPHRYAAFGDWSLAGRNIRNWSPEELRAFLDQYNIGWVITWSRASPLKQGSEYLMPLSTDIFARMQFCEPVAKIQRHTTRPDEAEYTIFRVLRESNYFAKGRGRVVQADYNRIELADVEPNEGELVLRYHWQEQFTTDPVVRLSRADVPGDPVGFVRIVCPEPVGRLVLTNSYR